MVNIPYSIMGQTLEKSQEGQLVLLLWKQKEPVYKEQQYATWFSGKQSWEKVTQWSNKILYLLIVRDVVTSKSDIFQIDGFL